MPNREEIIKVLNDIKENDIPFWELDPNCYDNNMDSEESKEFAEQCIETAVDIINKLECILCTECRHKDTNRCPAYDAPMRRTSLRIRFCNCGER